jgi:uncharacterized membrane protein
MIRKIFFQTDKKGNKEHSGELFRIEAISDAVFALSVSLLIMSLEVPKTFEELKATIVQFPPFVATVGLVFFFWYLQNCFFRDYGINDHWVIFLNLALLTLILFYAFPLKFLFALLLTWITGINFSTPQDPGLVAIESVEAFNQLIIFFSAGYAAIWHIFYLLYQHASRTSLPHPLTSSDRIVLWGKKTDAAVQMGIAIAAIIFALLHLPVISGLCYLLIPVWLVINQVMVKRKGKHAKSLPDE